MLAALAVSPLQAQEVGQGAPAGVAQRFLNAFFRNNFHTLVSTPIGQVRRFGPTGYVQEFKDAKGNASNTFALVKADDDLSILGEVYQVYPAIYSLYNTVGVAVAGYPTMDTGLCSSVTGGSEGSVCTYQLFTGNYGLFAFSSSYVSAATSKTFVIKEPFYTRWAALGGITALGAPSTAETAITAASGITATAQQYTTGALYAMTSGAHTGKVYAVMGKVYTLYTTMGLHAGSLGLPTSDELQAGGGKIRQNFEGGSIEYTPATDPVIRPAVGGVGLSVSTAEVVRMNLGETITVRARVVATVGGELTDREVSWITSNLRVIRIEARGAEATLRAVGGGLATVNAVSEGKISPNLMIFVAAPCCQIGEGAPTAAIQQAFQDAVTRHRLEVRLPAANPVRRVGLGYVQELQSIANPATRYLLCRADAYAGVFVVAGDLLAAYESLGGPAGKLGYPTADATAGGRQSFQGGVLVGNPVRMVAGAILERWSGAGFETGALGPPVEAPQSLSSFTGATATGQAFREGYILKHDTGRWASAPALVIRPPILAKYGALGGPGGRLGFPISEEYANNGLLVQDFEGGQLRYAPGSTEVEVEERQRRPEVSIMPSRVVAGSKVRVIVGGFKPDSRLAVSFTGPSAPPPFEVYTGLGAYAWDLPIPASAASGTITVTAGQAGEEPQAAGGFTVTSLAEANLRLVKLSGDTQIGLPGARLPEPLVVVLRDEQGTPLAGVPVVFQVTPGSQLFDTATVTDELGQASTRLRLLKSEGIALVTAEAAGKLVTFSARAAAGSLSNFPKQTQAGSFSLGQSTATVAQKGALLAAVSSILRYHQNRNELPSSLGFSDPAALNQFLRDFCVPDIDGGRLCDGYLTPAGPEEPLVNLWRLKEFVANSIDVVVEKAEENLIRDLLGERAPVLLALALTASGQPLGSHFVVATGIAADGAILIHDPHPLLNRSRLSEYTEGFSAAGRTYKATLIGAVRLALRSPSPTGFLVASASAAMTVKTPSGDCGNRLSLPGAAVVEAQGRIGAPGPVAHLLYCPGTERAHSIEFESNDEFQAWLTDLGAPARRSAIGGSRNVELAIVRANAQWQPAPIQPALDPVGVLNAASWTADLAPGSLVSIFGQGLTRGDAAPVVEIAGTGATVVFASPFQLNVEIPRSASPGLQSLRIQSPYGVLETPLQLAPVAPAIFLDAGRTEALIFNRGVQRNRTSTPAERGQAISIYATGLGPSSGDGSSARTEHPVSVVVNGVELIPSFAGPAPGMPGVYVINVNLPLNLPPGLQAPILLRQAGVESSPARISIR